MQVGPGTRALVTGASRGIGKALARELAGRGCTVGLVARSEDALEHVVAGLTGDGHRALEADVTDAESMARVVAGFGEVDLLAANAGIAHYLPFREMPLELVDQLTRVNWMGTVHSVSAVLPGMLERRRGHIVIVSSGAGV
jgi:short-subunit dehydrogenase